MMDKELKKPIIILATPHSRNDPLERGVRKRLTGYEIVRLRSCDDLILGKLEQLHPEFIFFPHWSWLIPEEIHSRFECVIFHMTDLPYGRGGSPLQNLIVRGHKETKLTALRCEKGLDTGPVYLKRPLVLTGTAEEILQRASALMEEMIIEIVLNHPVPTPQQGEPVVFKRRSPEDGNLAPLVELEQVYDYIRMLDAEGYPRAFLDTEHFHLEFSEANLGETFVDARVRIRSRST
jgi:methionyl-tRNA formyltransferase